jgi:hypothetical protein
VCDCGVRFARAQFDSHRSDKAREASTCRVLAGLPAEQRSISGCGAPQAGPTNRAHAELSPFTLLGGNGASFGLNSNGRLTGNTTLLRRVQLMRKSHAEDHHQQRSHFVFAVGLVVFGLVYLYHADLFSSGTTRTLPNQEALVPAKPIARCSDGVEDQGAADVSWGQGRIAKSVLEAVSPMRAALLSAREAGGPRAPKSSKHLTHS